MTTDLSNWQPRPRPARQPLEGRFVQLEPLSGAKHGDGLYEATSVMDADQRLRYLGEYPPQSRLRQPRVQTTPESVTAPRWAELTSAAYFARTPRT